MSGKWQDLRLKLVMKEVIILRRRTPRWKWGNDYFKCMLLHWIKEAMISWVPNFLINHIRKTCTHGDVIVETLELRKASDFLAMYAILQVSKGDDDITGSRA